MHKLKENTFVDLQLSEQIAMDINARKTLVISSIINAGKIISMFVIQQKDNRGHLIINKSTQDLKLALVWYNDCIKPANESN
jgi:oxalate decarboxylase/phosphoglucose isomerase-like protein (cupin superfamily)